jgi:hypothetical protein
MMMAGHFLFSSQPYPTVAERAFNGGYARNEFSANGFEPSLPEIDS